MFKISFRELVDEKAQSQHLVDSTEAQRLYDLSDRWLARELVNLSRRVIWNCQENDIDCPDITSFFVTECVPEIAARLGETQFLYYERHSSIRDASSSELRQILSECVYFKPDSEEFFSNYELVQHSSDYLFLTRDPCRGNPAAFGLDRIAPPDSSSTDKIARSISYVAQRSGPNPEYAWHPKFNLKASSSISTSFGIYM